MTELIPTISEIVKYGLQSNLMIPDKENLLERHLVKIYILYFDINYKFDESDFPEYARSNYAQIRQNVASNFNDFGYYKTVLDIMNINNLTDCAIGDAIDDLSDIICDLLEIKWRIENNSLADGLWFFEVIFKSHTQQHTINLLNYMKMKSA